MATQVAERAPDAKIKAARDGWMIRMCAGGVPVTDFLEVVYSIDKWDDWCRACLRLVIVFVA